LRDVVRGDASACGGQLFSPRVNYSVGKTPLGVAIADLNHDGKLDIVTSNDNPSASVLLGSGDGTFQPVTSYDTFDVGTSVAVADFNGDGHPDLAVSTTKLGIVSFLLGNGDGSFQPQILRATRGPTARGILAADVNLDGEPDLVVCHFSATDGGVSVYTGDLPTTFGGSFFRRASSKWRSPRMI